LRGWSLALKGLRRTSLCLAEACSVGAEELFDRVVELSGLSRIIGPGTVRRALLDAGLEPSFATAEGYRSIASRLDARLRAYLSAREAQQRMRSIQEFLASN
jgi:hypothetical protein